MVTLNWLQISSCRPRCYVTNDVSAKEVTLAGAPAPRFVVVASAFPALEIPPGLLNKKNTFALVFLFHLGANFA